jgi:hypothetical protein
VTAALDVTGTVPAVTTVAGGLRGTVPGRRPGPRLLEPLTLLAHVTLTCATIVAYALLCAAQIATLAIRCLAVGRVWSNMVPLPGRSCRTATDTRIVP